MYYKSSVLKACALFISCAFAASLGASLHAATAATDTTPVPTEPLDVDGDGTASPLTDGLLALRYLFGLRGQPLIQSVIGSGATRTTAAQIESHLAGLTASLPNPANCSIAAVPTSSPTSLVAVGTQVQLTASCATGVTPVTYTWNTGVVAPGISVTPQVTTTYTVTPTNDSGPGIPFSTTVHVAPPTPGNCSITQSPDTVASPVSPGTLVQLTANCATGGTNITYTWNLGVLGASLTVAPQVTTTYTVTPTNSVGQGVPFGTTVNVSAPPPPPRAAIAASPSHRIPR